MFFPCDGILFFLYWGAVPARNCQVTNAKRTQTVNMRTESAAPLSSQRHTDRKSSLNPHRKSQRQLKQRKNAVRRRLRRYPRPLTLHWPRRSLRARLYSRESPATRRHTAPGPLWKENACEDLTFSLRSTDSGCLRRMGNRYILWLFAMRAKSRGATLPSGTMGARHFDLKSSMMECMQSMSSNYTLKLILFSERSVEVYLISCFQGDSWVNLKI